MRLFDEMTFHVFEFSGLDVDALHRAVQVVLLYVRLHCSAVI